MGTARMREDIIRITRFITLDDLRSGRICPVETYRAQVLDWIITPSKSQRSSYDAVLSLRC